MKDYKNLEERSMDFMLDLNLHPEELVRDFGYTQTQIRNLYSYDGRVKLMLTYQFLLQLEGKKTHKQIIGPVIFFERAHYNFMEDKIDYHKAEELSDKDSIDLKKYCDYNNIKLIYWFKATNI